MKKKEILGVYLYISDYNKYTSHSDRAVEYTDNKYTSHSDRAVEYTDSISAEG